MLGDAFWLKRLPLLLCLPTACRFLLQSCSVSCHTRSSPASCVHVSLTKESAMCEAATEEVVGAPEACCKALPSNTGIDA